MKKIVYIFIVAILFSSCEDWLDINKDPNRATKVDPNVLFGYATMSWSANRVGGDQYIPLIFAAQTMATGGSFGWGNDDVYDISPYSTGNTWKMYYATSGTNIVSAIELAENSSPKQPWIMAQGKIVLAMLMYEATTLYGDIPFKESWKKKIDYPKFDPQKEVFDGILELIDEALKLAKTPKSDGLKAITSADLFYQGDMQKWIKLANSLKLKVAMTAVDADPSKSAIIKEVITENNMISSQIEAMLFPYFNEAGKENPKYKVFKTYGGDKNDWYFANENVVKILKPTNDPRIPIYFTAGKKAAAGEIIGIATNAEADSTIAKINFNTILKPDAPDVMLSYQEVLFFQSEAYARGIGVSKDLVKANELFKSAVKQAMLYYGVEEAVAQSYVTTKLPDLTTVSNPVKEIHLQHWVDLMDRPLDALTQWCRSGVEGEEVPALTLPAGAPANPLFRRYESSPEESTANPNTPKDIHYYDKMWFDK